MGHGINWEAVFAAYCGGTPEEELCQIFDIPWDTLQTHKLNNGWNKLRNRLPLVDDKIPLDKRVNAKLEIIAENRKRNYDDFVKLREHAEEMVVALKEGRLKLEKQWNNKGVVVRVNVDPGPGDWLNIATYLRTISEGTYRALGDVMAQEKGGADANTLPSTPHAPAITIILPAAIAAPRGERLLPSESSQVVDLTAVKAETKPIKI